MKTQPNQPNQRGYHVIYRENAINYCPGCGRTQWHIGRTTAECAFCSTALPLEGPKHTPVTFTCRGRGANRKPS